jgi:hypothetical protein
MTDATTRQCCHCGERFSLVQRSGRNSRRARANRERSYHQEQRYCSATCRKLASKARRARLGTPIPGPVLKARTPVESVEGTEPFSGVATGMTPINLASISGAQKRPGLGLQMMFGGYTVVADLEWPSMYRVRRPDGTLTDMANLTRARDAAQHFADQDRRVELKEAA